MGMTREEVINELNYLKEYYNSKDVNVYQGFDDEDNEAIDLAIKALEQEPCEDAISRQEALYLVADYDLSMGQVVKGIHALPPVTLQPKTGRWKFIRAFPTRYYNENLIDYECSECGRRITCTNTQLVNYSYCHCGAKMEVEE